MNKPKVTRPKKFPGLLVSQPSIRNAIVSKIGALNMTFSEVIQDMKKAGVKLDKGSFSRYINYGGVHNSISEETVMLLCSYLGVKYNLQIVLDEENPKTRKQRTEHVVKFRNWLHSESGRVLIHVTDPKKNAENRTNAMDSLSDMEQADQ